MRRIILIAAALAVLRPVVAPADGFPWPEILPNHAVQTGDIWSIQRIADGRIKEEPSVHVSIGIEADNVAGVEKDLLSWMEAHGVKNVPCSRQIFSPASGGSVSQQRAYCQFVMKSDAIDEAVVWIKSKGSSTSHHSVRKTDYKRQLEEHDKITSGLQREITTNSAAWRKMPGAASIVGSLWARVERNRRILIRNADTAELMVTIDSPNR